MMVDGVMKEVAKTRTAASPTASPGDFLGSVGRGWGGQKAAGIISICMRLATLGDRYQDTGERGRWLAHFHSLSLPPHSGCWPQHGAWLLSRQLSCPSESLPHFPHPLLGPELFKWKEKWGELCLHNEREQVCERVRVSTWFIVSWHTCHTG